MQSSGMRHVAPDTAPQLMLMLPVFAPSVAKRPTGAPRVAEQVGALIDHVPAEQLAVADPDAPTVALVKETEAPLAVCGAEAAQ